MPLGSDTPLDELVHPALLASIDRFFNGRVTIQEQDRDVAQLPDYSVDPFLGWSDRTGLVDLEAAVWPRGQAEVRGVQLTVATATHVAIIGQAVNVRLYDRAVVTQYDGATAVIYNITAILWDSKGKTTRLEMEQVAT